MTNPEQREKIARDALEEIAAMAIPDDVEDVGDWIGLGFEGAVNRARTALAAIIALDPAPGSCEHEAYMVDTAGRPTHCVDCGQSIPKVAYTPRPAPDVETVKLARPCGRGCNNPKCDKVRCYGIQPPPAATLARSSGS